MENVMYKQIQMGIHNSSTIDNESFFNGNFF